MALKGIFTAVSALVQEENTMDRNHHFYLAEIRDDEESQRMLTEFENRLAQHIGGDVVLIAYKRDENEDQWS